MEWFDTAYNSHWGNKTCWIASDERELWCRMQVMILEIGIQLQISRRAIGQRRKMSLR